VQSASPGVSSSAATCAEGFALWYAVYVKARTESAVCRTLQGRGYEAFLPLYRSRRYWSDRVKLLDMPLFPGYVFCRFDARKPLHVVSSPGVVYVVAADKEYVAVDEREMESLRILCGSGLAVQPCPYLQVGSRVLIERGPLSGAEGNVLELKNKLRIVVSVSLLQRSVSAEIDREWVREVHGVSKTRAEDSVIKPTGIVP